MDFDELDDEGSFLKKLRSIPRESSTATPSNDDDKLVVACVLVTVLTTLTLIVFSVYGVKRMLQRQQTMKVYKIFLTFFKLMFT